MAFNQENSFENVVGKMAAILSFYDYVSRRDSVNPLTCTLWNYLATN